MTALCLAVCAPAKVNLFLHVTGRRADGYHLIESLFALVDFADRITVEVREDGNVVRANDVAGVPEDADLALRAARLLKSRAGVAQGCAVRIDKAIPLGAGLGGGSSDAASVLLALNRLWNLRMPRTALAALALELGADVPFFVHGENAIVRGVGEAIEPVSLPRQWIALAMPRVSVPTASIFAAPELTRSTPSAKMNVFSESYGHNDLEAVAAARHAEVKRAIAALRSRVASARMTGSGAAAIAACASEEEARRALDALPRGTPGRIVRTLPRHPLAGLA